MRRLWQAGGAGGAGGAGEHEAAAEPETAPRPEAAAGAQPAAGPAQVVADRSQVSPDIQVSKLLRQTAAWSWRLLLTAAAVYLAFRIADYLRLVTLPFIAALLFTALLQPFAGWLRRHGAGALLSTWCCFLIALLVIGGAMTLVATQISADYPTLFAETTRTATEVQRSLAGPPFHLNPTRLSKLSSEGLKYISQHKSVVAGTVLTTGKYALEFLAGIILTLFISFFLLKDGHRIWRFVISGIKGEAHRRADRAGEAAWQAVVHYIRGTTVVAAIHALFIGLALWLLGVPLLAPFIVLIFLAAYVPIIGILVVGALAILVTLATKGWVAAVILLGVFILENQIEDHLLQPLVIGRIIRLHPLAIILVLAVGGVVAGIPGAIIAVPVAAVITYAWPELRGGPPEA
ncbi:MAG TPA: AI-2E family transporter [Streptosporangiaceae bacterium]|nr:AI-2E family transporter [Streptosporangiaceae bacterium]